MKRKKIILLFLFVALNVVSFSQAEKAFGNIEITEVAKNIFVYTYKMPSQGGYPANGMFCINNNKALLVDTPGEDGITDSLINWIQAKYNVVFEAAVMTHWHMEDRLGGLLAVHKHGIKSYASMLTIKEAENRKLPIPQKGYEKTVEIKLGEKRIIFEFPGAGHTIDNSVVWFPEEKVLFGGCLVKDVNAKNLGYTKDANTKEWPKTIKKLQSKYKNAKVIIPGHNQWGDPKLTLKHNLELLTDNRKK